MERPKGDRPPQSKLRPEDHGARLGVQIERVRVEVHDAQNVLGRLGVAELRVVEARQLRGAAADARVVSTKKRRAPSWNSLILSPC